MRGPSETRSRKAATSPPVGAMMHTERPRLRACTAAANSTSIFPLPGAPARHTSFGFRLSASASTHSVLRSMKS
eukprot:6038504-Alexandrium_andersonii.AAC.1